MKGLLVGAALLCTACPQPARHPDRTACYRDADADAVAEYLTLCAKYENTRECPHGDAIEERHGARLRACP